MTDHDSTPAKGTDNAEANAEAQPEVTLADVMAELRATRERYDAKTADLARQLGKLKERTKAPAPAAAPADGEAPAAPAPQGDYISRSEARAMAKLEGVKASLPDELRARADEIAETSGAESAILFAEAVSLGQSLSKSATPAKGPARAASAPAASTVSAPTSTAELMRMRRENPSEYRKVMDLAHEGAIELPTR